MRLTALQKKILQAIADDIPLKAFAKDNGYTYASVSEHIKRMRKKYHCHSNISLVLLALKCGQIEWPKYEKVTVFTKVK